MNPLVRISDNRDKLDAATEWAVEVGGDDACHHLWSEWNVNFKDKFQWVESCRGRIQYYGDMDLKGQSLYVKCDFLKVNDCVLMLFQPHGRFSAHSQMKNQVKAWLGNSGRFSITDTINFFNNQFWVDIQQEGTQFEQKSFPYGARSAVLVESEHHLNQFVEKVKSQLAERNVSCIRLPQSEIMEYKLGEADGDKMPMHVYKQTDLINEFVVTFFSNSGNYGDREILLDKAKEWFPNTRRLVSQDSTSHLLSMIENPGFSPHS